MQQYPGLQPHVRDSAQHAGGHGNADAHGQPERPDGEEERPAFERKADGLGRGCNRIDDDLDHATPKPLPAIASLWPVLEPGYGTARTSTRVIAAATASPARRRLRAPRRSEG